MDGNDTIPFTDNFSDDDSFSITFSSEEILFPGICREEKGTTLGAWKRVGAKSQPYIHRFVDLVETGDGWLASDWFGEFRYFENGCLPLWTGGG